MVQLKNEKTTFDTFHMDITLFVLNHTLTIALHSTCMFVTVDNVNMDCFYGPFVGVDLLKY